MRRAVMQYYNVFLELPGSFVHGNVIERTTLSNVYLCYLINVQDQQQVIYADLAKPGEPVTVIPNHPRSRGPVSLSIDNTSEYAAVERA